MAIGDLFVLFFARQPIFIFGLETIMQIATNGEHGRTGNLF